MTRLLSAVERIQSRIERRERDRDNKAVRRALLVGSPRVKLVRMSKIRERDRETCHLCGRWVSVHEQSFDHIVPLSKGGEHTYDNIKLAHQLCNSKKGDRLMSEIDFWGF
jgi:5-methylcytosine-specific restriction endonuclease McrA